MSHELTHIDRPYPWRLNVSINFNTPNILISLCFVLHNVSFFKNYSPIHFKDLKNPCSFEWRATHSRIFKVRGKRCWSRVNTSRNKRGGLNILNSTSSPRISFDKREYIFVEPETKELIWRESNRCWSWLIDMFHGKLIYRRSCAGKIVCEFRFRSKEIRCTYLAYPFSSRHPFPPLPPSSISRN